MRRLDNLDIERSIQLKKLIFNENNSDGLNRALSYSMFSGFVLVSLIMMIDLITSHDIAFPEFFFFPIMIFGLHGLYCQFNEMKLKEIRTNIQPEEIKRRIAEYSRIKNYRTYEAADYLLFLNEPTYEGSSGYEQTTFIFIRNEKILYTVLKETTRFNTPVLFAQYFKARDLKRILK
ncbi:hypothetical protein MKJ01_16070 [Chryseobacterium sp. SSA4.19]|uniref:hypothetical protein n=1 Tax=Chryseobacterium sp. SSA4.19 TaxID=2919915 RepID=UPI001F4D684E|nr:hypothetical protein [Chryseobacterium sp. SSA4.19]MCJ8155282.1 hypothetical protein [Chryseobacterium sp. SSA4.19]